MGLWTIVKLSSSNQCWTRLSVGAVSSVRPAGSILSFVNVSSSSLPCCLWGVVDFHSASRFRSASCWFCVLTALSSSMLCLALILSNVFAAVSDLGVGNKEGLPPSSFVSKVKDHVRSLLRIVKVEQVLRKISWNLFSLQLLQESQRDVPQWSNGEPTSALTMVFSCRRTVSAVDVSVELQTRVMTLQQHLKPPSHELAVKPQSRL